MRDCPLALDLLRRSARCSARSRGKDDTFRDRVGNRLVVQEIVLERAADRPIDGRRHLRVGKPLLRLALKLGVRDETGEDRDHALPDVLGSNRETAWHEIVDGEVVAHRLDDRALEAVLVGTAGRRRDAVDERDDGLLGRLRPRNHTLDLKILAIAALEGEVLGDHRALARILQHVLEVRLQTVVVAEREILTVLLVLEDDREAAMQVRLRLQAARDQLRVQTNARKDLRVRVEGDRRAGSARRADAPHRGRRLPT
jgi:hypothetical protein